MDYINAIIFGIVQGITEFLPISSSGHLVVLHEFIGLPVDNELVFDVVLHFATLLAVFYFFRKDIYWILKSILASYSCDKNCSLKKACVHRFINRNRYHTCFQIRFLQPIIISSTATYYIFCIEWGRFNYLWKRLLLSSSLLTPSCKGGGNK